MTIWTGACARRRSSTWPDESGYRESARRLTPTNSATWFQAAVEFGIAGALSRDVRTHRCRDADAGEAITRVAREAVEDLAADGVVYAEIRWAPELHVEDGLSLVQVIEATVAGFRQGEAVAADRGTPIRVGALATAMRHAARSREIAELAVQFRDDGVFGFDIAGAEAGFPPSRHLDAFEFLRRENAHFTIHAGEAFGLPSIWEAIQWCGTDRLGHGVRIVDDITRRPGRAGPRPARAVRPRQADPSRDVSRPRTSRPVPRRRLPNTRSACCATCASGSR